ncbi:plasmid pRiA4b ORF-3-like protein [Clostridium puniceum]|uniref:Plasmid pRiA4b ORF-3-like protein n=1 Tax=Clostridium puniceum TaxID=29367 RepID=A0A1S8TEM7_9CLOT|nr:plasmid pRiA4b ORF-3 family protein [Clostridium puniceum]OOM76111.1 plasmid pRiA4b ORF-3-like protein [Clostridium puniceum]
MNKIRNTIKDFEKFIKFVEAEKSILSAAQEVLSRKDCYNLNMLLENNKDVEKPSHNQDKYFAIDLMFELSLSSKLFIKVSDEKGKVRLVKTEKLENYLNLNEYEKYVFMLQTYWTKYDFEIKFDRLHNIVAFYNILARIANAKEGDTIVKEVMNISNIMYSTGAAFFHHLKFFGFGELELIDGAKGRYEDSIKSFSPNQFGIEICSFLLKEVIQYWNREDVIFLLEAMKVKVKINKEKYIFDVFKNIFKENTVKNTVEVKGKINKGGNYTFKVSLSKTIWRKIDLSYKHTLGDLHSAIQKAFKFDDDHLYAFYMGGNRKTGKTINCKYVEHEGDIAENTTIESLELYKGERFLYLFDFGDEWEFNVELVEYDAEAPVILNPMIIESKGKSPEQYGGGW